jgi:hypothetical protein
MKPTTTTPAGPPAVHEWTGTTGRKFRDVREPSGTYYRDTTPRPVIDALEDAARSGERVRLFYGDPATGRPWLGEHDVAGTVSRSMGPIKVPILLASARSHGGGAILTDHVVAVVTSGGRIRCAHRNFLPPVAKVEPCNTPGRPDLRFRVLLDGGEQARFTTEPKARRWADFMTGRRMAK